MTAPPRPDEPPERDDTRATWRAAEAVPVFLIAATAAFVLALLISLVVPSCSGRFILGNLLGEATFFVTVLLWVRYVNRSRLAALGASRRPLYDAGVGLAVGLLLVLVAGVMLVLSRAVGAAILGRPPPEPQQVAACVRGTALVLLAPVVVLAAPLGEETFFRGFLYKGLRRRFSTRAAAVISAALFGLVHFAGPEFLLLIPALFVVGLGLALLYERRQSLPAAIAAHAAFNLVGFLVIALSR